MQDWEGKRDCYTERGNYNEAMKHSLIHERLQHIDSEKIQSWWTLTCKEGPRLQNVMDGNSALWQRTSPHGKIQVWASLLKSLGSWAINLFHLLDLNWISFSSNLCLIFANNLDMACNFGLMVSLGKLRECCKGVTAESNLKTKKKDWNQHMKST